MTFFQHAAEDFEVDLSFPLAEPRRFPLQGVDRGVISVYSSFFVQLSEIIYCLFYPFGAKK